jgi:hypothetical protein
MTLRTFISMPLGVGCHYPDATWTFGESVKNRPLTTGINPVAQEGARDDRAILMPVIEAGTPTPRARPYPPSAQSRGR